MISDMDQVIYRVCNTALSGSVTLYMDQTTARYIHVSVPFRHEAGR